MLKANDLWQFSLSIYSRSSVKNSCLLLQDHCQLNVNIMLTCAYLERIGVSLSVDHLRQIQYSINESEERLKQMRQLRRQAKTQNPQQYQTLLSEELQWEQKQQQSIVDCLNSLQLSSGNSDNLSLYSQWASANLHHPEQVKALHTIRLVSASYPLSLTQK